MVLELRKRMCGLPDMSHVDRLGALSVATFLVFCACNCGTVSIVATGGMLLIMCDAASRVCVLARSGGAISGRVIFGNAPGMLHQVVHW
jgi:hypothetical protein